MKGRERKGGNRYTCSGSTAARALRIRSKLFPLHKSGQPRSFRRIPRLRVSRLAGVLCYQMSDMLVLVKGRVATESMRLTVDDEKSMTFRKGTLFMRSGASKRG